MIFQEKQVTLKDGTSLTLKTPDSSEAQEVLTFIQTVTFQTPYFLSSPEDFKMSVEKEEELIKENIESPNYFIVVYDKDKIIGDCNLNMNRHIKDRHRCSIGIGIDQDYCNRGLGSYLFDELIELARNTQGIEQIDLSVNAINKRAIHLYLKKGFEITGKIPRALKLSDGSYCDELLMTKFLY